MLAQLGWDDAAQPAPLQEEPATRAGEPARSTPSHSPIGTSADQLRRAPPAAHPAPRAVPADPPPAPRCCGRRTCRSPCPSRPPARTSERRPAHSAGGGHCRHWRRHTGRASTVTDSGNCPNLLSSGRAIIRAWLTARRKATVARATIGLAPNPQPADSPSPQDELTVGPLRLLAGRRGGGVPGNCGPSTR